MLAGEVEIRSDRFQAFVGEQSIDLTRREFELIELLASAEGRVLEREEIYSRLWGYTMVRGDRSVDVFVRKLRQKLEKASPSWRYIHTHFGIGYRFAAESLEVVDSEDVPSQLPAEWSAETADGAGGGNGAPSRSGQARAGRRRTTSSPPAPSRRTTATPPFLKSTRAPVSWATTVERSGSWPTSSTRPSAETAEASARAPHRRRSRRPAARCGCASSPAPRGRTALERRARRSAGRAPWG